MLRELVTTSGGSHMTNSPNAHGTVPKLALHLLAQDVRREALEFLHELHSQESDCTGGLRTLETPNIV